MKSTIFVSKTAKERLESNKLNVTGMTVNRLYELCRLLIAEGKGDLGVLISRDDDGNSGIHHCFYDFTEGSDLEECLELDGMHCLSHDVVNNPSHYILLG